MKNIRRGFTLIELLIVIVIIGILSSGLMLSSSSAIATAEASNIVSNLRTTKAALLLWYIDNVDTVTSGFDPATLDLQKALTPYLDNPASLSGTLLKLGTGDFNNKWILGHTIVPNSEIADKLEGRAMMDGLFGGTLAGAENRSFLHSDSAVWVLAR